MQSATQPAPVSNGMLWAGWVMSALPALFLFVDGVMKLMEPAIVVETTVQLGYPESVILGLGIVLLACTVLYAIPGTAVLGDPVDRLSGRCRRHPRARRGQPVFDLLPGHLGRAALGRAFLSRSTAARLDFLASSATSHNTRLMI